MFANENKKLGYLSDINNNPTSDNVFKFILNQEEYDLDDGDILSIRLFDGQGGFFIEKLDKGTILNSSDIDSIRDRILSKFNRWQRRR